MPVAKQLKLNLQSKFHLAQNPCKIAYNGKNSSFFKKNFGGHM